MKTEVELPVPAVLTELPHSEETAQEEPVTLEQESTTAERGEPAHVQSIPSEGEATKDYTNSTSEEGFSQPEMVQSSPVQNVQSTACKSLNDSNLTGEELPSEAAAAELTISADSEVSEENSNYNDLEAGTTSSQVSAVMEKSLSELALGPELSHTATEEFPSFQTAGSQDSPNVESAAEGGLVLAKQEQGRQSMGLTLEPEEEPEQQVPLEVCAMEEPPAGSNEDEGESEESAEDLEGDVADEVDFFSLEDSPSCIKDYYYYYFSSITIIVSVLLLASSVIRHSCVCAHTVRYVHKQPCLITEDPKKILLLYFYFFCRT